jgi:predicted Holliday junction resolvase-like endonuclease
MMTNDVNRRSYEPTGAEGVTGLPARVIELSLSLAVGLMVAWLYIALWKARYTASIRGDAVMRSQAVTSGKVYEQLLPYLPDFPYNPRDVRFLGSPTDLIVFDGLADGEVLRVVFLEVKTGGSGLTTRERSVRDAIQAGKVEWLEVRVARALDSGAA